MALDVITSISPPTPQLMLKPKLVANIHLADTLLRKTNFWAIPTHKPPKAPPQKPEIADKEVFIADKLENKPRKKPITKPIVVANTHHQNFDPRVGVDIDFLPMKK